MGNQVHVATSMLRLIGLREISTKPPEDIRDRYRGFLKQLVHNCDTVTRFSDTHRELANKAEPDALTETLHALRADAMDLRSLAQKAIKSVRNGSLRNIHNIQEDWARLGTMYEELESMVDDACRLICPDLYQRAEFAP